MRNLALLFLLLIIGSAQIPHREGLALLEAGNVEAGLAKLEEATRLNPTSREYRQAYFRNREIALHRLFSLASNARQQAQWDEAEALYRRMLVIDPQNPRVTAALNSLAMERRHRQMLTEAEQLFKKGSVPTADAKLPGSLAENAT